MVPGGGIEPPTRGFSIHCSTPELPGHRDSGPSLLSGSGVLDVPGEGVQSEVALNPGLSAVSRPGLAAVLFQALHDHRGLQMEWHMSR